MRKFEGMKKVLSAVLALSMVLSYAPVTAFAVTEDGSCAHHTHDESCGYVAAVEGADCGHECSDACKTKQVTSCIHNHEASGCVYTPAVEAVACDHQHDESCNYNEAENTCDHVHGDCAYREAVEESWSCGHVCSVENGCITFVCAHVCPEDNCGFVAAVEGSECMPTPEKPSSPNLSLL